MNKFDFIKVKEAIEKVGCTLVYLPTYSPDLNPIQHCWANYKQPRRKQRGIECINYHSYAPYGRGI